MARVCAAALVLALLPWPAPPAILAQERPPISFGLRAAGTEVRPGGTLPVTLVARIPRGWHLYGLRQPPDGPVPTNIEVGPAPLFSLAAPVTGSAAEAAFDANFGMLVEWHSDSARFQLPVRAARVALPGAYDLRVRVAFQSCSERVCLPLVADTLVLAVAVAGAPEPVAADPDPPTAAPPGSTPAWPQAPLPAVRPDTAVPGIDAGPAPDSAPAAGPGPVPDQPSTGRKSGPPPREQRAAALWLLGATVALFAAAAAFRRRR